MFLWSLHVVRHVLTVNSVRTARASSGVCYGTGSMDSKNQDERREVQRWGKYDICSSTSMQVLSVVFLLGSCSGGFVRVDPYISQRDQPPEPGTTARLLDRRKACLYMPSESISDRREKEEECTAVPTSHSRGGWRSLLPNLSRETLQRTNFAAGCGWAARRRNSFPSHFPCIDEEHVQHASGPGPCHHALFEIHEDVRVTFTLVPYHRCH